jgi:thiosulfate/3-mercaptopyruvate sulfurtransferase
VEEDKIGSEVTLVDARSGPRFTGEAPEPRAGLSSGHIKDSINLPFTDLLTPQKAFLSKMSLKNILKETNIDDSKPIIVMCGTGVTACVIRCAMQLAGLDSSKIAVYDGSWTEWAQRAPSKHIVKDV